MKLGGMKEFNKRCGEQFWVKCKKGFGYSGNRFYISDNSHTLALKIENEFIVIGTVRGFITLTREEFKDRFESDHRNFTTEKPPRVN